MAGIYVPISQLAKDVFSELNDNSLTGIRRALAYAKQIDALCHVEHQLWVVTFTGDNQHDMHYVGLSFDEAWAAFDRLRPGPYYGPDIELWVGGRWVRSASHGTARGHLRWHWEQASE